MIEYLLQDDTKLQRLATTEIVKVIQAAGAIVLDKLWSIIKEYRCQ